jgi:hypothetical protein
LSSLAFKSLRVTIVIFAIEAVVPDPFATPFRFNRVCTPSSDSSSFLTSSFRFTLVFGEFRPFVALCGVEI